jgi:hypothetical protein
MASFSSEISGLSSFAAEAEAATQKKQRRTSVQSLAKLEANVGRLPDKDALFASIKDTFWTVADHHRLYAIDRLQTRIMEYHNNVHSRDNTMVATSSNVRPDDVVAFLMTCSASHTDKLFQPVEKGNLSSVLKKTKAFVKGKPTTGLQWIHMMDLSALPTIADELQLDPLCREHFRDLRFHSMKMPLLGGCCMSLCYFQLDPSTLSVGMFKLYFYVTNGFVLTFVAELMPDLDATKTHVVEQAVDRDGLVVQELMAQQEGSEASVPIDAVFNAVVDRWETLVDRANELGPVYVFYELAAEALSAQDTLMEFLSRSIFHFKRKTTFRLPYRKKLQLVKRLHIVNTAISMVESCTSRAALVVDGLIRSVTERAHLTSAHAHAGENSDAHGGVLTLDALVPYAVLGVRQLPVLVDLQNSYAFVNECLQNEAKEVRVVSEAIDSISQMRADHTALVLSLIATIFLPATFLTGVFGMNFQEHAGYTIEIVNSKFGPLVFYCICVALAFSLCLYYISMGWIEAFGWVRYILNMVLGKRGMIRVLGEDFDEDVNDDPASKHPKLVSVAGLGHNEGTTHGVGAMSELTRSDDGDGVSKRAPSGVVRSPLSAGDRASSAGDGAGRQVSPNRGNVLVPQRVAEALEEESRRNTEARRRRELALLQGMQPSTTALASGMRGTVTMRPTLQHRSRASASRSVSSADGSTSAHHKS